MKLRPFPPLDSLQIQLLSRSLLILALLLTLIGFFQYIFMRDIVYKNKALSLQSQLMSIPRHTWDHLNTGPEKDPLGPPFIFIPDASLAYIDANGNYTLLSDGPDNIKPLPLDTQEYMEIINKRPSLNYKVTNNGETELLEVLCPIPSGPGQLGGVLQVSTLTSPLKELIVHQLFTFLTLALVALLFGLLGFLPLIRRTLLPLSNMVTTAEQIDAGNLDRRFPTEQGQTEIDRLAESFNRMLERLEASFEAERETKEQMRRFIADASHELRTPLTSIHGFLEVLLRGAATQPEQLDKALKSMHSESKRLNKLVHDLLLLTKLDRKAPNELTQDFLAPLIRDMEPQLHILAGNRELTLCLESDAKCRYDRDQLKQVILNLFQNAVQHTDPEKGHIKISLSSKDNKVQLSVQDNGPGISTKHLPHIYDRFYRSDSSRTRKYGGAGLGLSITKSIVEAHKGSISVESEEGNGCIFHIWIPE